jgi:D-alanyl-D-alanine endopeptidase (penicillin-binding protein 7)
MVRRDTFPRVLLLLAVFVFFSANTVYFLEDDGRGMLASVDKYYHFDFDHIREKGPYLNVKSAILVNYENGEVVYTKNADRVRPVASISKLVTAMVVLDKGIDLTQTERITKKDAYRSSRSRLAVGFELTLLDMMYASLMNSDNRATRALCRAAAPSMESFVEDMNAKVKELGLENTVFYEPTGLDSRNVSTAHEVAKIVQYAFEYDLIRKITSQKKHRVKIRNRKNTYRQMANTNLFVHSPYEVLSGKTGYIRAADYCLATIIRNNAGERLTVVVLGAPGDRTRFREARKLANWGFEQV